MPAATDRLQTFPISAYEHLRPLRPAIRQGRKPDWSTPDNRGWGKPGRAGARKAFTVQSVDKTFQLVAMRKLADHAQFVLEGTVALGYPLLGVNHPDGGVGDFVVRPVRGTTDVPSWHSWNVAFDINSGGNKRADYWRCTIPPEVVEFWLRAGFDWGGYFRNPYDTHHIEYCGRPSDVAADNVRAREALAEILARRDPPEEPDMSIDQVKAVQQAMNDLGWTPPLVVDGSFRELTTGAVSGIAAKVRERQAAAAETARRDERRRGAAQVAATKSGALAAVKAARAEVTELASAAATSANARLDRLERDLAP